jgi:two-component system sensor histidine kinase ChiS
MATILAVILPVLLGLSWLNHQNSSQKLEESHKQLQKQTESQILQVMRLIEAGHQLLGKFLDQEMVQHVSTFAKAYENAFDVNDLDLSALKKQLDDAYDLYIINHQGIVEYSTYFQEIGADLSLKPSLYPLLQRSLDEAHFVSSDLISEQWSSKLRKFGFAPTPDGEYILGLAANIEKFSELLGSLNVIKLAQQLRSINPTLLSIKVFTPSAYVLGEADYRPTAEERRIVEQIYRQHDTLERFDTKQQRLTRYIFANMGDAMQAERVKDADVMRSKVIQLVYSTWEIQNSLENQASIHFIVSAVAIVISVVLTFLLAAWITRPINQIVRSVDVIAQGDLDHPIEDVQARNELIPLKQSIMLMVRNMLAFIRQIQQHNDELKQLDKLKDDFLSNTSHELRTPLHGIIGIADSMLNGATGDLSPKARENLTMISLSGRRLTNLINDILDFSRLKHNDLNLSAKALEVNVVVDVVLTLLKPLIGSKKLILSNHVASDLPPVNADETRLQQILYNLIGNAIKFTEAGIVEINAECQGDKVIVSVADTGVGIAEDKHDTIFNSFEQADGSAVREYGGTGLGLSITKRLVEVHGGKIWLESALGEGTTMYFSLPLATAESFDMLDNTQSKQKESHQLFEDIAISLPEAVLEDVSANQINQASQAVTATLPGGKKAPRVLIVDDEPVNLQVLENLLLVDRYEVTRAHNGLEALDILREQDMLQFSMILLDVMMPKMSGYEVCRIIRKTYPASELPVIMLTAKNQISDLVAGLNAGANDYLSKPFSQTELSARIRTHIQLAHITQAYSHFVPHEFLKLLDKNSIMDVALGDHVQRDMSVLFMDIRSFTSLSEKMTPQENFDFINAYLSSLSPVIRKHRGFIDKYIGDAIMALFPFAPEDALHAVLDLYRELKRFNAARSQNKQSPVQVGVGLHYGTLMLGTIGESKRMEGTVIADAVNLSSRLEGLTKLYGASIIISEEILNAAKDPESYSVRVLGKVRVKGKEQPVKIFELLDESLEHDNGPLKMALRDIFNSAMDFYYRKQFSKAAEKFRQVLVRLPHDKVSHFYLERCLYYSFQRITLPENWDGVEELHEK